MKRTEFYTITAVNLNALATLYKNYSNLHGKITDLLYCNNCMYIKNIFFFSSSVIQQKVLALNTIANILSLQTTGIYENIIDIPVEQIFFVVRLCLDENTPSVLNVALKAMRNLFYNQVDETCLDVMLGFGEYVVQPVLSIDEEEDDKTINDQQLAETNLVKCLARTNILIRIR